MKTISLFLLVSFFSFANNTTKPIPTRVTDSIKSNYPSLNQVTDISNSNFKIVSCDSKKMGKHIYVISDSYTKKKVTFYAPTGEKVYGIKTTGTPIYLSKLPKGNYKIKIVEGKNKVFKEYTVL